MDNNEKQLNDAAIENTENDISEAVIEEQNIAEENEAQNNNQTEEAVIKEETVKKQKMHSKFRFKYGSYATAVTAVFLALVILLNVVVNILNEKYPMTIDMTGDGIYTVSADNAEFLKTVDYPVELKVLFTEEQYDGGYIGYYKTVTDSSNGKYYKQTVDLLKQYKKYNSNIAVSFVDPYTGDEIGELIQDFSAADLSVNYGDILVECYVNGKDKEPKRGVIEFIDCYQMETNQETLYTTGTESYTLNGNKVEQAVANGIFKTVNLTNVNIALLTLNSTEDYVANFKDICTQNAFNITPLEVIQGADLSKYEVMMICAPSSDYTESEIKTLEKWLENDGKKGKTVLFFASAGSPQLPNLYAFLEEWGIGVEYGGKYYSKNSRYYSTDRTNIYIESCYTDYTSSVDSGAYSFIANNMVPLTAVYETKDSREVTTVAQTMDISTYIKPDRESGWTATGAGEQYPAVLLSKDADDGNSSYVIAVSSIDFLTTSSAVTKTDNGNFKMLIGLLNNTSRSNEDVYVMETKVVSDTSGAFTSSTTDAQTAVMGVVFVFVIPAALIIAAIAVYVRRKNY